MDTKETYKVYKIRRKADGLYSHGGSSPSFGKEGKEWYTLGAIGSHLGLSGHRHAPNLGYYGRWSRTPLEDVEIVTFEYEVNKKELGSVSLNEYYNGLLERRKQREAQGQKAMAKYQLKRAEEELAAAERRLAEIKGINGQI